MLGLSISPAASSCSSYPLACPSASLFPLTIGGPECLIFGALQTPWTPAGHLTLRLISNSAPVNRPPGYQSPASISWQVWLRLLCQVSGPLLPGPLLSAHSYFSLSAVQAVHSSQASPSACQQALFLLSSAISNTVLQTPGHHQTHGTCSP